MELTKERMLEIAKRRKDCDFCFTPEPCSECERGLKAENDELWEFYDRVIELLQADADGRCVVLPCNIGDTIWDTDGGELRELRVQGISITRNGYICLHFCGFPALSLTEDELGKTIFRTRKEAEKALKGGAENA